MNQRLSDKPHSSISSFSAEYYNLTDEPKFVPFHRRDFYKIWLLNNEGILGMPGQQFHIRQPALVFLNPLILYSFQPLQKERTGYWCIFTEEYLTHNSHMENLKDSALFKIGANNVFYPDKEHLAVINFLFEQIVSDFNSVYTLKYQSIRNYIELLIHEGMKMEPLFPRSQHQNAASRIAGLFLNLLEKQYPIISPHEPLKLKKPGDFADQLAIHVNHLNAVVREVTGKSTSTHIAERMINESKALLNFSSWSVADIAYSLGFEYPNHFNNFFKKHTGNTPLSLRK